MEQNNVQQTIKENNLFREIFYVLKKNILIFVAIIILATAVGGVYAFTRSPKYIAQEQVLFSMGEGVEIANDINTMNAYKATVESFAGQGVVVDRANYYSKLFFTSDTYSDVGAFVKDVTILERKIKSYQDEIMLFDAIEKIMQELNEVEGNISTDLRKIKLIQKMALYQQTKLIEKIRECNALLDVATDKTQIAQLENQIKEYNRLLISSKKLEVVDDTIAPIGELNLTQISVKKQELNQEKQALQESDLFYPTSYEDKLTIRNSTYVGAGNIGISYTDKDEKTFVFSISYSDSKADLAINKVKLLALAFNVETSYFFTNMNAKIDDLGLKTCSIDISKTTIVLFSIVIGFVLAVVVVYVIYILDKTIKTKEEAERISGYPVLACIESQEVRP